MLTYIALCETDSSELQRKLKRKRLRASVMLHAPGSQVLPCQKQQGVEMTFQASHVKECRLKALPFGRRELEPDDMQLQIRLLSLREMNLDEALLTEFHACRAPARNCATAR